MNLVEQPDSQLTPAFLNANKKAAQSVRPTLLCLSHLRWGFVYQRPQHVMSRLAKDYDVLFFEEPLHDDIDNPWLEQIQPTEGVTVLVPRLPAGLEQTQTITAQRELLDAYLAMHAPSQLLLWYFTPMSLDFTSHLEGQVTIFDCMDELSAFKGAPKELVEKEQQLMHRADVVFTGGFSLWEAKSKLHDNAHAVPSSVDLNHFAAARQPLPQPLDQVAIAHPRLGFFGVIDERFDVALVSEVARQRPEWQIVLIGPVVKIDPAALPRYPNIHYLGCKDYSQLPAYLAGWDVALMPFALNESTRFISPTKTPEYLAGGCPVVSSPIVDVVRVYGHAGVVAIAASVDEFIAAIQGNLDRSHDSAAFTRRVDAVLDGMSWDKTCAVMKEQIECLR
ncbi:glycosyltransferase family 1 protein [Pseudomonas sp. PCH199]|uniref:glycosyltransferase family 1 protein n=1 Tax=unclassified Pseudomonas TaxID=196821 RepID=UPI000BD78375|nr:MULTISPECIES: glycosyltransferase family 1 protein [unclassified Pseudomonas]MCW8277899.1 glycosyltransferase family 1 protein [Pseudomonas sp. PCH199]PAM81828.1 glycosyl transferase [Pseudomonas sp. ERMR1:02]